MTYYKIIDGIRYDRGLLDAADQFTRGRGEWRLSLEEIQQIFRIAEDGQVFTETEWRTLRYIAQEYPLTDPARTWLDEKMAASEDPAAIDKLVAKIVHEEFGFQSLRWQIDRDEVRRQLEKHGQTVDIGAAVRGALNAFLEGGVNQLSLEAVVRRRTGNGEIEDKGFLLKTTRDYMEGAGLLFLTPEAPEKQENFDYDLPRQLDFDLFWQIGLHIPALSPVLFMSSVSRKTPGFQHSIGYISRRPALDDLIFSVVKQLAQFTRLKWEIDTEEVNRQLDLKAGQNFGEALFGALHVGIFNGESSFSFQDFIRQEIWPDPDREVRDYMREYIETGTLRLLSPETITGFKVPEFLMPDFGYDWVFGLEMPKKTEVRFVITASREFGFDASWNDGFLPETPSLEEQTRRVLESFKLPNLQVILPVEEYETQRTRFGPDYRTFASLLRQALNTILHDYLKPNSVFNRVANKHIDDVRADHFDDPLEYRAAIRTLIFNYLNAEGNLLEFLPVELPDNNPVDGEPIQDFWQFYGFLPALSSVGFWVIIPRYPDDDQRPYCYGLE